MKQKVLDDGRSSTAALSLIPPHRQGLERPEGDTGLILQRLSLQM